MIIGLFVINRPDYLYIIEQGTGTTLLLWLQLQEILHTHVRHKLVVTRKIRGSPQEFLCTCIHPKIYKSTIV